MQRFGGKAAGTPGNARGRGGRGAGRTPMKKAGMTDSAGRRLWKEQLKRRCVAQMRRKRDSIVRSAQPSYIQYMYLN